jgi:hypothetical protein
LGYRKVCCRWVLRLLSNKHKRARMDVQLLQRQATDGNDVLLNTVSGDESWLHQFGPGTKRHSMEFQHAASPKKRKPEPRMEKLWDVILDAEGYILVGFLPRMKLSTQFATFRRSRNCRVLLVTSAQWKDTRWYTAPHCTPDTGNNWKVELETAPPSSLQSGLGPLELHLFGPVKDRMKGQHYENDGQTVRTWLRNTETNFYPCGIFKFICSANRNAWIVLGISWNGGRTSSVTQDGICFCTCTFALI